MLIKDYSGICYRKSFLVQVIIRIDFFGFIPSDRLLNNDKIEKIREIFPRVSMQQIMRFNDFSVSLSPGKPETTYNAVEGFRQSFMDQEDNKLTISNKYLILEINHYTSFENTFSMFDKALSIIDNEFLKASRTGIRYINIYEDGPVKLSKKLFNSTIGALVNIKLSKQSNNAVCVRSMCMNEYHVKDMKLNFRYGMYNPNYPNTMRVASFVLDYDCYSENIISGYENIISYLKSGHEAIQQLFEESISDSLRTLMN